MKKLKVQLDINGADLKNKLKIKDGYTPIKGVDYFDGEKGEDAVVDTDKLALEASTIAVERLKPTIPTIEQIEQDIPKLGQPIRDSLELLPKEEWLSKNYIAGLEDYDEIAKLARKPKVENHYGGGGGARQFTSLTDVPNSYSGQAGKYPVVNGTETGLEFGTITPPSTPSLQQVTDVGASTTVVSTFSSGLITPKWYPSANSTTALQILKADGTTSILNVDTTNSRIGVGFAGTYAAQLNVSPLLTTTIGLNLRGIASQTANLLQFENSSGTARGGFSIANQQLWLGDLGTNSTYGWLLINDITHSNKPAVRIAKYTNGAVLDLAQGTGNPVITAGGGNTFVIYTTSDTGLYLSNAFSRGATFDMRLDHDNYGTVGFYARGRNLRTGVGVNSNLAIGGDFAAAGNKSTVNMFYAGRFTSESAFTHSIKTINHSAQDSTADIQFGTTSNGTTVLYRITKDGGFVFNENGADADCRIEGDTDANLFVTDAGTDTVSIGGAGTSAKLNVRRTTEQQRWEYDGSNFANISVGATGNALFDADGANAGFTFNDVITDNAGSFVASLDTNARQLLDEAGTQVAGWGTGETYGFHVYGGLQVDNIFNFSNPFVDFGSGGDVSILTKSLVDGSGVESVDAKNRKAYDATGTFLALDWGGRQLYDSTALLALDWGTRSLNDTSGTAIAYWGVGGIALNINGPVTIGTGAPSSAELTVDAAGSTYAINTTGDVNITGALQCDSITSDTGLAHGTYTPTLTGVTNVASSTAYSCQYMRLGNVVTVSGMVEVTPTANNTQTTIRISLPIASAIANNYEVAGTAHTINNTTAGHGASIEGDATNNEALMDYYETHGASDTFTFHFTYSII